MAYIRTSFILFGLIIAAMILENKYVNAQTCGENEVYSECGTDCQRTCDHVGGEPIMCNHRCALGCFCSNGYVRKSDTNSLCVKESEC